MKKSEKKKSVLFWAIILASGMFSFATVSLGATDMPTPTVEDCVERMGLSEEKCAEMIEKFKNMTPEERAKMRPRGGPPGSGDESSRPPMEKPGKEIGSGESLDIETQIERAGEMKSLKEEKFSKMTERLEKILEYLKSKSVDTSGAEENIATFKEKVSDVLSACDTYIAALENSRDSNDGKPTDAARDAREKIRELFDDLREFFRDTLLANLRSLIETLAE